jgi:hypothetical protein
MTFLSHRRIEVADLMAGMLALGTLAFLLMSGTALARTTPEPPGQPGLASLLDEDLKNRIPDQYIVVFKPGTSSEVVTAAQRKGRMGRQ